MVIEKKNISCISHLECAVCRKKYAANQINLYASCEIENCRTPLFARYEFLNRPSKEELKKRINSMWRYFEMLPVVDPTHIVSLGEGMTPLFSLNNLAEKYKLSALFMKDESSNPTGSFKARGFSAAISKAKELGIKTCIVPTAGNAGGAMSAYCAKAGMEAIVVMPRNSPTVCKKECKYFGAKLILVDGFISDCARVVAQIQQKQDCFDLSTMKEPYRLEGKKTMGYEIAEQLNWKLPDVIFYPTGGGTGLIGIWKAFQEMTELEWLQDQKLPRMIAVQTEKCQPVVWSYENQRPIPRDYQAETSIAKGLLVPHPFAGKQIIQVIQESNGFAIAVSEKEILDGIKALAKYEGVFVAPEGGAIWSALLKSIERRLVSPDDKILLLNTGSAYKYTENLA